eukprot:Gregarina_sp_Poly_1__8360@NODE_48_length_17742_cov_51_152532_g42_i0_p6_GENE_NODE_48_length_17742_cov_51_152532_g42_i0NODE_48_length_17742_cov_51_152532_g42_i0_p6_ORF_typecomplete_len263_score31_81_NODE_48_length_17742_cov_51_152532_g42_i020772865
MLGKIGDVLSPVAQLRPPNVSPRTSAARSSIFEGSIMRPPSPVSFAETSLPSTQIVPEGPQIMIPEVIISARSELSQGLDEEDSDTWAATQVDTGSPGVWLSSGITTPATVIRTTGAESVQPATMSQGGSGLFTLPPTLADSQVSMATTVPPPPVTRTPWLPSGTDTDRNLWIPMSKQDTDSQKEPTQPEMAHANHPISTPELYPPETDSQNDHRRFSFMSEDFCDNGGDVDFDDSFGRPVIGEGAGVLQLPPPLGKNLQVT